MKRFILMLVMAASMSVSAQEDSLDSLRAFVQWWKTEGVLSVETRVGVVPCAQKDYRWGGLWLGDLSVVADGGIVHFKLAGRAACTFVGVRHLAQALVGACTRNIAVQAGQPPMVQAICGRRCGV